MKKLLFLIALSVAVLTLTACMSTVSDDKITTQNNDLNAAATTEKATDRTTDKTKNRELSNKKIEHSFGVASNEKVHTIAEQSQNYFDSKNFDAVTYDKDGGKVLYLTFDCGYENGYTSKILDTLKEKNVKAAFFCTLTDIKSEPELIKRMIDEGHTVGNHSTTHPSFAEISREEMANEIKVCDNYLRENFGYSAPFFRFPKGEYSDNAIDLVNSLGYKCIFWSLAYNDWNVDAQKGAEYAFEKVTSRLHPGAVILLHSVSSDNAQALGKIIDYAKAKGYEFKSLSLL